MGRRKKWAERMDARFPEGTLARLLTQVFGQRKLAPISFTRRSSERLAVETASRPEPRPHLSPSKT